MNTPCHPQQTLFPLSSVQREIWFDQLLYPDTPVYNIGGYYKIDGFVDPEIFKKTITMLVQETDIMRMKLATQDGVPMQSFPEIDTMEVPFFDYSDRTDPFRSACKDIQRELQRTFQIFEEPLFRYSLYRISDKCHLWAHTYNHLLIDGWGIALVSRRAAAIYNALIKGEEIPENTNVHYLKFIESDEDYLHSEKFDKHRLYWQRKFSFSPEPLLSPRPEYSRYKEIIPSAVHTCFIPKAQYRKIEMFCNAHSVSVFHFFIGLLYVYFTRVHDKEELIVGLPVLNRGSKAFKQTIGLFAGEIPERFCFGHNISFIELMKGIAAELRTSYRHQNFPVSEIKRIAGVFNSGINRLFDISLSFEKQNYAEYFGGNTPGETVILNNGYQQTPLTLFIREKVNTTDIQCDFAYNLAFFNSGEIEQVCKRIMHLFEDVLADPAEQIINLNILPKEEKQLLLKEWNSTEMPVRDISIHELFEEQVRKTPDGAAAVFEDKILTFAELNIKANKLAHKLIALGVKPETIVAIALERSPEMIIALLAVLKAGGAYLPLDPDYPAERLEFMIKDSNAKILITKSDILPSLKTAAELTLCLDEKDSEISNLSSENPGCLVGHKNLAYVIYTSGSTGKPKGVAVEHHSISNHCLVIAEHYNVKPCDRFFQFFSFSFDAAVEDILSPLSSGAALILSNLSVPSPEDFDCEIKRYLPTILHLPPVFFHEWISRNDFTLPDSIRIINVGGDVLPKRTVEIWNTFSRTSSNTIRLINGYGPTESTVHATMYDVPDTVPYNSVPIGRHLPHRTVYILDKYNQTLPIGIPGELHVGGIGLARGYLNRPELTAEKFIKDPFSTDSGARLYKTGDLARYLPDGNIEFLGRIDNQVKIRGFRIELGEIESALTSHPGIKEAVVIARADENGDKKLVAYIVPSSDETGSPDKSGISSACIQEQTKNSSLPAAGELRDFLKASLPDYMLPASFVLMETLPLTPNGKVDRMALPEPEASAPSDIAAKPRNAIEEILTGLWSSVLHKSNMGINDNFFELGGHSLLATKLTSKIRETLSIDIPVRWLFESPTVAQLSERIAGMDNNIGQTILIPDNRIMPDAVKITPDMLPLITLSQEEINAIISRVEGGAGNIQDIYPLAPLQEGILFHHRIQEKGDTYLIYSLLSFDSYERSKKFTEALQTVINRHDILRTSFLWEQLPGPVQVVWRQASLTVEVIGLDPVESTAAEQLLEYCNPNHMRMDISRAPLMQCVTTEDNGRILMILLLHHLIADHTTLEILLEEIKAISNNKTQNLPKPVPFRNFVALTKFGIPAKEHEKFFRDMLSDIETPTSPFGLMNVQNNANGIAGACLELNEDLSARLRTQTRLYGATPAALCHMAWALVLSRCCAQEDVVFGSVLSGRMQGGRGMERTPGMFINTLPVRITCNDRPVSEALKQTQQLLLSIMRHEHASLSLAQSCSAVPAPAPLFSALLNYRHSPKADESKNILEGMDVLRAEERSNYPFNISVDDLGEGFLLTALTDASVDPGRICGYMQCALESLTAALENKPLTPLCNTNILSDKEKQLLLKEWNSTEVPVRKMCTHKLFEEQVIKSPNAAAVIFENETLTYAELNARANRLAHKLIDLGVRSDTIVAIALERSHEMIIALLSVLKAGGAYLPLDTDYPSDRMEFMIRDSEAKILITHSEILPRFNNTAEHTLCLDEESSDNNCYSSENPDSPVSLRDLAYIIYTSGSTGKPKGVTVEHRSVAFHCQVIQQRYRLTAKDKVLQFASFSFDTSVEQILPSLSSGATIVLPAHGLKSPEELNSCLLNNGVTVINLPPALFSLWASCFKADPISSLRLIILGGDVLTVDIVRHTSEWASPRPRILNAYGPTETTVTAITYEIPDSFSGTSVPIGRPLPMRKVYILDRFNQPLPIGIPGELHIGGMGLARGYLNRPELTDEKFIKDPFSAEPGSRLYKTGDLARYLSDGNIEFLGRIDNQVKIRGFRIELGEIESALTSHCGIKEAVVIARVDEFDDKRLVAYVIPTSDGTSTQDKSGVCSASIQQQTKSPSLPSTGELRDFLKASLPDYMLPTVFVFMSTFPLTPNGKVDRRALPEPEEYSPSDNVAEPHNAIEEILLGLWSSVLHKNSIGINDNFFDLGGHSLLATQLVSRMRDALDVSVPIRWIFEFPTVARLAGRFEPVLNGENINKETSDNQSADHDDGQQKITTADRNEKIPLSFTQQRLWFLDQLEGPGSTYNMPGVIGISGSLNVNALNSAFSEIIRRHEALRTTFLSEDGVPQQIIRNAEPVSIPITNLSNYSDAVAEAEKITREFALRPFNLKEDIPIRLQLLQTADYDWRLLVSMHHSASDGWSFGILTHELSVLYTAFTEGKPSPLKELDIQYADYSVWQRNYLQGPRLERLLDYWRSKLEGVPECISLPTDHPRPAQQSYRGGSIEFSIDPALTQELNSLSRKSGVTLFMTLFSAWACLLSKYSGQEDIVIGSPVAGRTQSDIEPLIGSFINTLALRADLQDNPSFSELLRRIRKICLEAYAHQELPFESLVDSLGVTRSMDHSPLFQTMFVLQNNDSSELQMPGLDITVLPVESTVAKFDLTLSMEESDGMIAASIEYAADLFERSTIERMCAHFSELLKSLTNNAQLPVSELNILAAEEKQLLLKEWNNTEASVQETCVHKLFEEQVRKTPDAAAVIFKGKTLTYSELNTRANQLAHKLIALGIRSDTIVAIALERSHEMTISLMAVLKAGGAYLPLDTDYPTDRLEFMIRDSEAKILITCSNIFPRAKTDDIYTLCIDEEGSAITNLSYNNPDYRISVNNLAYVIYTSGSTGRPKGVAVEHRGLINLAQAQIQAFSVKQTSRVMQFASFSFDASVSEIMMTLCSGAVLYIPDSEERMPGDGLLNFINNSGITHITLPPAALASLPKKSLPKLECLIVAGEACTPQLAAYWSEGRRFFNAYGPTEATVCTTIAEFSDISYDSELHIGRPIANTNIYILNRYNQPVPVGIPGELHIGGMGLARGYLNRPELTTEKFIRHPFSKEPGARLYKTGDLARYLPDGNIEFHGRIDNQIKIRGFRIELGEIESTLTSHPCIKEAVAIACTDETNDKKLVAYVVPSSEVTDNSVGTDIYSAGDHQLAKSASLLNTGGLREFLKTSIPDFMLPAAFVFMDKLPLTPNGKVDRKALPEPEESISSDNDSKPRNAIEEILAGLWSTVLHKRNIGINDNFFELGGHSLLAAKLASRMREALGIDIPVRWLFESPTVSQFSERISNMDNNIGQVLLIPENCITPDTEIITPDMLPLITLSQEDIDTIINEIDGGVRNIQDIYPLAPLQEGILFHHRIQEKGDAYISYSLLSFDSYERSRNFTEALQTVIDRHDILRTSFMWEQLSKPVQAVWRTVKLPVEILEFDPADGPVAEQILEYCSPNHTRMNISSAPLMRLAIAREEEKTYMIFLSHHLILDHATLEILFEEIKAIQNNKLRDLPMPVPFRNFVAQTKYGISKEEHEKFFRDMLYDIETPTAPFGLMNVQGDGVGNTEARLDLPDDLSARLRTQTHRYGATPAALCHMAWALVLSRCSSQTDVVFGSVLFGRMQGGKGVERTPGMFINTLPVRITCDNRSVSEALKQTQQLLLSIMKHEHASLSLAQNCSSVPKSAPLFSALMNYRHSPGTSGNKNVLEGIDILRAEERSNYPFNISVDDLGDGFALTAQTDASVDPDRICGYMQRALESLINALEDYPQTPLYSMDILPCEEKQLLLKEWNKTEVPVREICVHELFEEQVRKTPDAAAVIFEGKTLTYAQLNHKANQLSHRLIALGVKPDTIVAIALERSHEMIMALLAVLKAGGAYLPLDTDYPTERLEFMIKDSDAKVLITDSKNISKLKIDARRTLCLGVESSDIAILSSKNPDCPVIAHNLAYIIYTSGSTGKPKGVAVEHKGLINLAQAQIQAFSVRQTSRVMQFASFSFDASVSEIMMALCSGASLYIPNSDERMPGDSMLNFLNESGITHVTLPPAALAVLPENTLPNLQCLIVAGEACTPKLAAFWSEGRRFFNAYGPTEATVCTSIEECNNIDGISVLPIGKPVANTNIYILDKYNQPLPIGIAGELHIGGIGLARGYLNRPELTAEKFIKDPFSSEPGARLYKTGDLARYMADGRIEFLGRIDNQVKIRGFRIELGEIESALTLHPGIKETVVIARADENGDKKLVAYIVPSSDEAGSPDKSEVSSAGVQQHINSSSRPAAGELREFLKSSLPNYMTPAAFVFMDNLPLTPNGKVDRKALPLPELGSDNEYYVAPRDTIERQLVHIWESLVSVSPIGVDDNFFELGGHSLLVVHLTAEIEKFFGKSLPVMRIFEFPTISAIASLLRDECDIPEASCLVRIRPNGTRLPLFFLPGAGGVVSYLYPLVQHLDPDIPFFAFQAKGLERDEIPDDLTTMAEHYVSLLLEVQPHGPYFLAGHSFGGHAAFMMAQILLNRGEKIGLLAIADTYAPGSSFYNSVPDFDMVKFLSYIFQNRLTVRQEEIDSLSNEEQLDYCARRLEEAKIFPENKGAEYLRRLINIARNNTSTQNSYTPESFIPLPITLIKASESGPDQVPLQVETGEDFGWNKYSDQEINIHYVPGNHMTMMTSPGAEKFAQILSQLTG